MVAVYIYVLDTLADWELGYVTAELHSGRFFRRDGPGVSVKTVGISREPVRSMGGLAVVPDCTVCAICGATATLAKAGLLDGHRHTGNGAGYLKMVAPGYKGQRLYVEEPSVADRNLITAGSTGALLWAKQILERLGVFRVDTLEAWYRYFSGGEERDFFALMGTLEMADDGMKGDGKADL